MTFGTGTLRVGSTGDGVTELQQWLIDRSFLLALVAPSGSFDDATHHAVRAFQFSAGIGVDGVVGDGTRTAADAFAGTALNSGWHPRAVRNVQHDRSGGAFTTTTRRGLLHTTEGTRLPTYDGTQPHFTIGRNGAGAAVQLWQHLPITVAARALRNESGGAETNRYGVIQIEIIGSAANMPTLATDDPDLFRELGQWMRWVESTAGVANVANHAFDDDSAYGLSGTTRLTQSEWEATTGWVGHQHVPENTHWDPGQIDVAALLAVPALATGGGVGMPGPAPSPMSRPLAAPTAAPAPTIRATTRRLTNAFPSLTFAIDTAGREFFEVMLTTDRTLFDPSQASRRTVDTFYRSGADGLRSAANANGRFVAPVGAVQRLALGAPSGGRVFYAIATYADAQGNDPRGSAAPTDLARTAPAVDMMPGFRGHTETESLGLPLSMVRRTRRTLAGVGARSLGDPTMPEPAPVTPAPAHPSPSDAPPPDDRLEGEDGYDVARSATPTPAVDAPPPPASPPAPAPKDPVVDAPLPPPAPARPPAAPAVPPVDPDVVASYDDGYGDLVHEAAAALATGFPPERRQPHALYDAESPFVGPDDEFDDLGWAGTSYASGDAPPTADGGAAGADSPPAATGPIAPAGWRSLAGPLPPESKRDIIEAYVGGETELYSAVDADGEYAGRAGTDHPAYQRHHLGLSFGIARFSQDGGSLGQLLVLMRQRDEVTFDEVFGSDASALVDTLTAPGPLSKDAEGGRSPRVQPVGGADVWEEPWLDRFVAAGRHRPFQGAQIELAAGMYLDPVLQFAVDVGLASERGLAIIFDRATHRGVTGGLNWVIETVGPVQTPVLLRDALDGLGFADVESFQRTQPDLLVDDQFGPLTHAALTAALRASGATSPPRLDYEQMIAAIVDRATGQPWGDRIVRLARADVSDETLRTEPAR